MTSDTIQTSAEYLEAAAIPLRREVHTDPSTETAPDLPDQLRKDAKRKSPAQWAYERIILYIKNFEEKLDSEQEVGLGFVGGDAGIMRIEGLGFYDPDIVTFYGSSPTGARTQLVQHVAQLNVMLVASPKQAHMPKAQRIGFHLGRALEQDGDDTPPAT